MLKTFLITYIVYFTDIKNIDLKYNFTFKMEYADRDVSHLNHDDYYEMYTGLYRITNSMYDDLDKLDVPPSIVNYVNTLSFKNICFNINDKKKYPQINGSSYEDIHSWIIQLFPNFQVPKDGYIFQIILHDDMVDFIIMDNEYNNPKHHISELPYDIEIGRKLRDVKILRQSLEIIDSIYNNKGNELRHAKSKQWSQDWSRQMKRCKDFDDDVKECCKKKRSK